MSWTALLGRPQAWLVSLCLGTGAWAGERLEPADRRDLARAPKVALFRADGFPTVGSPAIPPAVLDEAVAGLPVDTLRTPAELAERLRLRTHDLLVLPYGGAFPLEAWPVLRSFLEGGGGLVVLGGAPFHQPVRHSEPEGAGTGWIPGVTDPSYARALLLGPAERWTRGDGRFVTASVGPGWTAGFPDGTTVYPLTLRLARKAVPGGESGAAGPRDAVVRPLVHVLDAEGIPRSCPLLEIDRLRGDEAGARWVLAPSDAVLTPALIRAAIERALQGAVELAARPVHAAVAPGEPAALRIVVSRPASRRGERVPGRATVVVRTDAGRPVFTGTAVLTGPPETRTALLSIPGQARPGLYHVTVETPDAPWQPKATTTGFWVRDARLLASAERLSASRDWLRRDGAVFPVIGTTYMASDVHRKFLFEPNPHVWDRDFATMARSGVNLVRTGLWTGWSRAMLDPGAIDEAVLSALDAFVLSAAKHRIAVCFTFFAFLPPEFGGTHPYLDPRALEGQRQFLTLVAERYRGVPWIHYDLINEPSYAPSDSLWNTRPFGDAHEARAFAEWARLRHGEAPTLRERWRDAGAALLAPPPPEEVAQPEGGRGRPRKVRDFLEFTNDVVAAWAAGLRAVLRAASGDALVTLGQDEGGTARQPAQLLHADSVDYTAVHTWWANDDLLWLGVATKTPGKPNLHQETGLMRLEDLDGMPWRTPDEAAALLERKFAYAFAARGAGAVEWAWNVNPYQPLDNEAVIGLFRPDGTAKPELDVLPRFAAFFRDAAPWLDDFEPDAVVLVIPHSRLFLGRPGGLDAPRVVTRVLADRFGVVPSAISELRVSAERLRGTRLVIVPSPEVLADEALRALLEASREGTKVLVTGPLLGNPYGEASGVWRESGLLGGSRAVRYREPTPWAGEGGLVTFADGLATQHLRRSLQPSPAVVDGRLGGAVWHEPLPLEFAREREPLVALLEAALRTADVETHPSSTGISLRLLRGPRSVLAVCVNETAVEGRRHLTVEGLGYEIAVPADRARLVLFERGTGRVLAATPGEAPALSP